MGKLFKTIILKFQVIVICLTLLSVNYLLAQNRLAQIGGNIIEKKTDKCTFVVHEGFDTDIAYNKNNTLMIYESNFVVKTDEIDLDDVVRFNERQRFDSVFYKIIAPFYKDFKSKYKYEVEEFDIILYSKADGKVCELAFSYSKYANIPIKAIEKLEFEIFTLGLKLEFDPNSHYTEDALWIYYPVKYSVSGMKKKMNAEKK